jgi:hypothetical protein
VRVDVDNSDMDRRWIGPDRGDSPHKEEIGHLLDLAHDLIREWPLTMDEHHRLEGSWLSLALIVKHAMLPEPGEPTWVLDPDGLPKLVEEV